MVIINPDEQVCSLQDEKSVTTSISTYLGVYPTTIVLTDQHY